MSPGRGGSRGGGEGLVTGPTGGVMKHCWYVTGCAPIEGVKDISRNTILSSESLLFVVEYISIDSDVWKWLEGAFHMEVQIGGFSDYFENHHEISWTPLVLSYHLCIPQSLLTLVQLSTMGNTLAYSTVEAAGGRVYRWAERVAGLRVYREGTRIIIQPDTAYFCHCSEGARSSLILTSILLECLSFVKL